jgi:hypothetical protein
MPDSAKTVTSGRKTDTVGRKVGEDGNPLRMDGKDSGLPADAVAEPSIEQVHEQFKVEQEQGFRGEAADPTPNEHYTVAGVLDDSKHVPEEFKTQTGVRVMPDPNYGQK